MHLNTVPTMAEMTRAPYVNVTFEQENSTLSSFTKGELESRAIILLIHSRKVSVISFSTILSMAVLLILLGICVNGVICLIMFRGSRYKRNTSNFFILHLSVTELIFRLLVFPLVIYFLVPAIIVENIHCKALTFVSTVFTSATFISLVAIARDRHENIVHDESLDEEMQEDRILLPRSSSLVIRLTHINTARVQCQKSLHQQDSRSPEF